MVGRELRQDMEKGTVSSGASKSLEHTWRSVTQFFNFAKNRYSTGRETEKIFSDIVLKTVQSREIIIERGLKCPKNIVKMRKWGDPVDINKKILDEM